MSGVSFPADVDECDAPILADKSIALLAGIRADGLQPAKAFPNARGIQWLLVLASRFASIDTNRPFTVAGAARA